MPLDDTVAGAAPGAHGPEAFRSVEEGTYTIEEGDEETDTEDYDEESSRRVEEEMAALRRMPSLLRTPVTLLGLAFSSRLSRSGALLD